MMAKKKKDHMQDDLHKEDAESHGDMTSEMIPEESSEPVSEVEEDVKKDIQSHDKFSKFKKPSKGSEA